LILAGNGADVSIPLDRLGAGPILVGVEAMMRATNPRYEIKNIDRQHNAGFGGLPSEHDRGCVIDTERTEPNVLTGVPQRVVIFFGTLAECWSYAERLR
jgi:hypothetical protein